MSIAARSRGGTETVRAALDEDTSYIGAATRSVSWMFDALLINLVAIVTGLGAELVLSLFPLSKHAKPALTAVAGVVYVLWAAAYFVVFWSTTGQTPGARIMQIRLVTAKGQRVRPVRAIVRWIGMNLAMVPLFAGYLPIVFGRRGFPDWLAHTIVLDAPQTSLAGTRREARRAAHDSSTGGFRPSGRTGQQPQPSDPTVAGPSTHNRRSGPQSHPPSRTNTGTS